MLPIQWIFNTKENRQKTQRRVRTSEKGLFSSEKKNPGPGRENVYCRRRSLRRPWRAIRAGRVGNTTRKYDLRKYDLGNTTRILEPFPGRIFTDSLRQRSLTCVHLKGSNKCTKRLFCCTPAWHLSATLTPPTLLTVPHVSGHARSFEPVPQVSTPSVRSQSFSQFTSLDHTVPVWNNSHTDAVCPPSMRRLGALSTLATHPEVRPWALFARTTCSAVSFMTSCCVLPKWRWTRGARWCSMSPSVSPSSLSALFPSPPLPRVSVTNTAARARSCQLTPPRQWRPIRCSIDHIRGESQGDEALQRRCCSARPPTV